MKIRLIAAAALVASFAAPAFAADEFYVVQDTSTKKCTIVDKKPTVTTQTIVSPSGTIYTTRAEAEAGMKTVKVCRRTKTVQPEARINVGLQVLCRVSNRAVLRCGRSRGGRYYRSFELKQMLEVRLPRWL